MPLTLKTGVINYRDPTTGNYVEIDAVGDMLSETIAPNYDDLTYPIVAGKHCFHDGLLYAAKQDIQTTESWTASHWDEVTVAGQVEKKYEKPSAGIPSSDLADGVFDDIVAVQDTEPQNEDTKIWFPETQPQIVQVASYDELTALSGAINVLEHDVEIAPKGIGSDADDVDLDITDEDGNVLMRLADGHIQTKKFNSKSKGDIDIAPTNATGVDLDITDSYGNSILRIANGHMRTQKFNSSEFVASDTNPLALIKEDPGLMSIFLHIGCIGDSLSSGAASSNEGGTVAYHDIPEHSFGQYMARFAGITCYNFSRGGLTTKTWWGSTAYDLCFDGQHKCEAYIIALGVNDAIAQMTVGSSSDIDLSDYTQNADSYYGNYGKIIQKIQELQPKAKIFVMTNPEAAENDGYNSAVRDMATIFDNVYIIDLRLYGRELFMSGQIRACHRNGHYNAVGYKLISKIISTYIDWIVSHNLIEFNQVELIGTDWSWNN